MQKRPYGDTGENLSLIGFGGIVVSQTTSTEAAQLVGEAVDGGVNYFDVAPSYGNAEERLGPALEPYRDQVFLACKTTQRSKEGAAAELRQSLRQMRTGHFDLYQLHAMTTAEDFAQATGPNGALEAFVEAQQQGLVRHLGFSAHSAETALKLLDHYPFASVLFPVNWVTYFQAGFGPQIMEKAEQTGAARLALKAMAWGKYPEGADKRYAKCWYDPIDEPALAELALRFSLSQPITAALPPGEATFFRQALSMAQRFTPITEEEIAHLQAQSASRLPLFELESAA
ncbi:MAG: aldo/keto reductase [Candidatus Latescibacteria bacterium]|nr:aldo/keto reductase [Candidatus Latescibacterota bacterium]